VTGPKEEKFETHFCERLEAHGYRKRVTDDIDLSINIDDNILMEFLTRTQPEEVKELKSFFGNKWLKEVKKVISKELDKKKLFEVLRDGITINDIKIRLIYFKPETSYNPETLKRYESNIFSYVRQFCFRKTMESIDIVLFLNGFALITIELKNPLTGQVVDDAVIQYIDDRDKSLNIFKKPILHIAADTKNVKIATEFISNSVEDFVWFNKDLINPQVENEYNIEYLYNEILTPESLIEIIEHYLHTIKVKLPDGREVTTFFFPRYHQRRTVNKIREDILKNYSKTKKLDLRYLIQHSAGSGKSYTIAILQRFLRHIHYDNKPLFDSIVILTDRINLNTQLGNEIRNVETQKGLVAYVETTKELATALNKNKKVVVSTIHKFSVTKLKELLTEQKGKKICIIIDEAHRSQTGKLHKNMLGYFEPYEENFQDELSAELVKRKFPNLVFIALTATPSDKTIQMFGKPFDVYSMDQAEKEGKILNVSDNIIPYETLYKLSEKIGEGKEYPPLPVIKKIKAKAYEDENIIKAKVKIIIKIFEEHTKNAIKDNYAKAMIVTSSRKAAVKYKLILDKELQDQGLEYKTLVAFTGSIKLKKGDDKVYTEANLNKIKGKIEDEFKKKNYRFLIVANKFQYGFNQPLLHTMFLDKSVSGINAVQTISRLNRVFPNKRDTLTIDFTNSYKEIIKAFRRYKKTVIDRTGLDTKELSKIYIDLINWNVFTKKDVDDFNIGILNNETNLYFEKIAQNIEKRLHKYEVKKRREFRGLLVKYNNTFNFLNNLFVIRDKDLRNFARFSYYMANYLSPFGKLRMLDKELEKIYVTKYKIKEVKKEKPKEKEIISAGKKREIEYVTVKEVVEAINLRFESSLSDDEKGLIEEYIENVTHDEFVTTMIKGNKDKDLGMVFKKGLLKRLTEKFMDFLLDKNPNLISKFMAMNEDINRMAVDLTARNMGIKLS